MLFKLDTDKHANAQYTKSYITDIHLTWTFKQL